MKYFTLILLFSLAACQSKPTKVMEESVNPFADKTVIMDTRNAFEYTSFHIQGSVNLVSTDFLILKNPMTKKRVLDPDLKQTIERLAHRGISPEKRVILLSNESKSDENKKWQWLLANLGVENVRMMSLNEFKKMYPNRQFATPEREAIWELQISEELQYEFILKRSQDCFVKWSDKKCPIKF